MSKSKAPIYVRKRVPPGAGVKKEPGPDPESKREKEPEFQRVVEIDTGECNKSDPCLHPIRVRKTFFIHGTQTEQSVWEDRGVMEAVQVLNLFREHKIRSPNREHFEVYKDASSGDQKRKKKYNKTARKAPKGTGKPESNPLSSSSVDTKHAKLEPGGEDKERDTKEEKTPAAAAAAPVKKSNKRRRKFGEGGGRALNRPNKKYRRRLCKGSENPHELTRRNVVAKVTMFPGIPHDDIKTLLYAKSDVFPAVTFNAYFPQASVSYSGSGEVTIAGASTSYDALVAASLFAYRCTLIFKVPYLLKRFAPVNLASSFRLDMSQFGPKLDLASFRDELKNDFVVAWEPQVFRGLQWFLSKWNVVVVLFDSGAGNIVGLKTEEQLQKARTEIVPFVTSKMKEYADRIKYERK